MPDNSAAITAIESILNSGTQSVSTDGLSTQFNLSELRKRLAELKATDDDTLAAGKVRPRTAKIRLNFH